MLLEQRTTPAGQCWFYTLTYEDEHLPAGATLVPDHGRYWRKRIYNRFGTPRFFFVGEYGSQGERPHYHAMLFGVPLGFVDAIRNEWVDPGTGHPMGFTTVGEITPTRCAYLASYTTKKLSGEKQSEWLNGRHPEFAQMSRRPALGDRYILELGEYLTSRVGSRWLSAAGDVPQSFRAHGKFWPIGRRHQMMLRRACGMPELRTEVKSLDPERWPAPEFPTREELNRRMRLEDRAKAKKKIFSQATL